MDLFHIHVSAVNWTPSKVGGPCFVFTPPNPNKIQSWTPLKDISLVQPVSLVPSPYIFSNFIPLDMDTQLIQTLLKIALSLSISNYNLWCCSMLFFYYVSPFWNLVLLQQITLIKKHKGNLPLLLVCTWRQRLLFSGYFHVNSLRKNSTLLTPKMAALSRGCKPRIIQVN